MLLRRHGRQWGSRQDLAVGFADMVGFTVLSQHLDEPMLAEVVQRFEEVAHDVVTGLGGRVVKTIGDEVMFVADDAAGAVRIGLSLAEAYADDDLLSDVRVGLAAGSVLANDGDYFGPTVNLASRIVEVSRPGAVLAADELHRQLVAQTPGEFAFASFGPVPLKDVGSVPLWWCGRTGEEPPGWVATDDVDGALDRLTAATTVSPRAAAVLCHVLRIGDGLPLGDVGGVDHALLYGIEKMPGCRTVPCIVTASSYAAALANLESRAEPDETIFDSIRGPFEIALAVCGFTERLGAHALHLTRVGRTLWIRFVCRPGTRDLLFHLPAG